MKKNDIGLLKYCFSVAGQSSQTETEKWIRKVEKCLEDAGAEILSADKNKNELFFQVNIGKVQGRKENIQYKIKITPDMSRINLEQMASEPGGDCAKKLMAWYAEKRNKKMTNGIKYFYNPIHLRGYVLLRNNWKAELIRRIADMNRIVMDDGEVLQALSRGKVPEFIQTQIREEYQEYENEIRR